MADALRGLQGFFTENLGQIDNDEVMYFAEGEGTCIGLTTDGLIILLNDDGRDLQCVGQEPIDAAQGVYAVRVMFEGHRRVEPVGTDALPYPTSSFVGNDRSRWVRGARSFQEVRYSGLYDGVDLRFYFKEGMFKYDYELEAGSGAGDIRLRYEGVSGLRVDAVSGDLLVMTPARTFRDERPVVLWEEGGSTRQCPGLFQLLDTTTVGFKLPGECPLDVPVTIDPGLVWGTYMGGSEDEQLRAMTVDGHGNIYVAGATSSPNFPTMAGAYNETFHRSKGYALKLDPTGRSLLFATFFGGINNTYATLTATQIWSVALDAHGNLGIGATTCCDDCPTTVDAVDPTFNNGDDGYFIVIKEDGSDIVYATYIGGDGTDYVYHLRFDGDGSPYMTGRTTSTDWPATFGAFCSTFNGGWDAYVVKLDPTYRAIEAMTYLGGTNQDIAWYMAVDADENAYLLGDTLSREFPTTPGAFQTEYKGTRDVFVTRLDPTFSQLVFSTLLGGSGGTVGDGIQLDGEGRVIVLTETDARDFPTTGDAQYITARGALDITVSILDPTGSRLIHGTYFGGSSHDVTSGSRYCERTNHLYIDSCTLSSDLPTTKGCYCAGYGGGSSDQAIVAFNLSSLKFDYVSYVGGSGADDGIGNWGDRVAVDGEGQVLICGITSSTDFPTTTGGLYQWFRGGASDGFILKMNLTPIEELPPAPSGLRCRSGNGYVDLSWSPVVVENYKLSKYRVIRSPTQVIGSGVVYWSTRATTFNDTDADNGKVYYYWVSAVNSVGEGARAGPVVGRPMGPPSEPRIVKAFTGDGQVRLTWVSPAFSGGGEILGYLVLRGNALNNLDYRRQTGPASEFVDAEVTLGTTYYYCVIAFNELCFGEQSLVVGIKALDVPTVPLRPALDPLDRGAHLTWQPPFSDGGARILGYHVLRSTTLTEPVIVGTRPPGERDFVDSGLVNGIEYIYQVAAFNEVGLGALSQGLPVKPIGTPAEPQTLAAARGDREVVLTWLPPQNDGGFPVTGYKVYAGRIVLLELETVGNVLTCTHKGLTNGDPWYYQVVARNEIGWGLRSNIAFAIPFGYASAPESLNVAGLSGCTLLTWFPPSDDGGTPITGYRIFRSSEGGPMQSIEDVLETSTRYYDLGVIIGRSYGYKVVALTDMGEGLPTEVETAVPYGPPGPPLSIDAAPGEGRVTLTWSPPENDGGRLLVGYNIYRGSREDCIVLLTKVATIQTLIDKDKALVNGAMFYYQIAALNEAGEGTKSEVVVVSPAGLPLVPNDLSATAAGGTAVLRWSPPTDDGGRPLIGYVISRGYSRDRLSVYKTVGTATTFTDLDVQVGDRYYYSVKAVNVVGEGPDAVSGAVDVPLEISGSWMEEPTTVWGILLVVIIVSLAIIVVLQAWRPRGRPGKGDVVEGQGKEMTSRDAGRKGRDGPGGRGS